MSNYSGPPPTYTSPDTDYMTVGQVAKHLSVSQKYVLNTFGDYPGVVDLSSPPLVKRRKRGKKRCLRIPRHVLERFLIERRVR